MVGWGLKGLVLFEPQALPPRSGLGALRAGGRSGTGSGHPGSREGRPWVCRGLLRIGVGLCKHVWWEERLLPDSAGKALHHGLLDVEVAWDPLPRLFPERVHHTLVNVNNVSFCLFMEYFSMKSQWSATVSSFRKRKTILTAV